MALWLDVGLNDVLRIDGETTVTVERKSGSRVRLKIMGKREVELLRNARDLDTLPEKPRRVVEAGD